MVNRGSGTLLVLSVQEAIKSSQPFVGTAAVLSGNREGQEAQETKCHVLRSHSQKGTEVGCEPMAV